MPIKGKEACRLLKRYYMISQETVTTEKKYFFSVPQQESWRSGISRVKKQGEHVTSGIVIVQEAGNSIQASGDSLLSHQLHSVSQQALCPLSKYLVVSSFCRFLFNLSYPVPTLRLCPFRRASTRYLQVTRVGLEILGLHSKQTKEGSVKELPVENMSSEN